jgi:hypothetical protein
MVDGTILEPDWCTKVCIFKEVISLSIHLLSVDHFQSSKYGGIVTYCIHLILMTGNGQLTRGAFIMK